MWKFCGNIVSAEFRRSKLCANCSFPRSFHTRKLGEVSVFYAVGLYLLIIPDTKRKVSEFLWFSPNRGNTNQKNLWIWFFFTQYKFMNWIWHWSNKISHFTVFYKVQYAEIRWEIMTLYFITKLLIYINKKVEIRKKSNWISWDLFPGKLQWLNLKSLSNPYVKFPEKLTIFTPWCAHVR